MDVDSLPPMNGEEELDQVSVPFEAEEMKAERGQGGSLFVELMDHEPDVTELEDHGAFESTLELIMAYRATLPPEELAPLPSARDRRVSNNPLTPLNVSNRVASPSPSSSSPSSPRLSPMDLVRKATSIRPRVGDRRPMSTSDVPTVNSLIASGSENATLAPPRPSFTSEWRSAEAVPSTSTSRIVKEPTIVVQDLRATKRKLKKTRPVSPVIFPSFSTSLSSEPESFRSSSPTGLSPSSPSSPPNRRSWRVSFSRSSPSSPSPLASPSEREQQPYFPRSPSPLHSFSSSIRREGALPPVEKVRKSKRDPSATSSEDSYHGDSESGRRMSESSSSNAKWVNALSGKLGWSSRKSLHRTGSSTSDGSSTWEMVSEAPPSPSSFEVMGRSPNSRSNRSSEVEPKRNPTSPVGSSSAQNLSKIVENSESNRPSPLPSGTTSQDLTPIPSPALEAIALTPTQSINPFSKPSRPLEFTKVDFPPRTRTASASASLLTASRPPSPHSENSAPVLPFKAREIFLAQRKEDSVSSDEESGEPSSEQKAAPRSAPSSHDLHFSSAYGSHSRTSSHVKRGLSVRRSKSLINMGTRKSISDSEDLSLDSMAWSTSDGEDTQASSAYPEDEERGDLTPEEEDKLAERLARSLQPGVTVGKLRGPVERREGSDKSGELVGEEPELLQSGELQRQGLTTVW